MIRFRRVIRPLLPFLLVVGAMFLFFYKIAFTNLILARGDTFLYFYPYWDVASEALRNGRLPLWNPDLFMGAPLLANSQVGVFYIPNWLTWLWHSAFTTPYKVSGQIMLHIVIAGCGAYLAGRRVMRLGFGGAMVTAVIFAFGGYLTAQVEHVNQLQGLAWLPYFLVVLAEQPKRRGAEPQGEQIRPSSFLIHHSLKQTTAVALLFTLQILAGHTQTAFITGIALGLWLLADLYTVPDSDPAEPVPNPRPLKDGRRQAIKRQSPIFNLQSLYRFIPLLFGAVIALALSAIQLLPTLELIQHSSRQGGLTVNEVLSFSLHPLLLTRSILPAYGQSLFSEYVAVLPVAALVLALVAGWQWRRVRGVFPALVWVVMGLFLALGVFNPANWVLARLPVFDLFRVPARWLVLYALGVALLTGRGWQMAWDRWQSPIQLPHDETIERPLRLALVLLVTAVVWSLFATFLQDLLPTGPEAPYEAPSVWAMALWFAEYALVYGLLRGQWPTISRQTRLRLNWQTTRKHSPLWLIVIMIASLFWATRTHPYNNPTTPDAYFDLRPAPSRLISEQETNLQSPIPSRFLSLSNIFFDPGDQVEIQSIYGDQLTPEALYDYTIAVKQKEILSPNLSMIYGIPSMDGFDGGILPLQWYSQLMTLILPDGITTTDGRLRENLTAVPDQKWLNLFNTRYIITDKVGDVWREGVFFDLQHPVMLDGGATAVVGYIPDYEATALWMVASDMPSAVEIIAGGDYAWRITPEEIAPNLYAAIFPTPTTPESITIFACEATPCQISGLSLVDSRDGTFQSLVPGSYRLIHSGDVKIYENLEVMARAFMVYDWQWQPDVAASITAMQDEAFDPQTTAVVISPPQSSLNGEGSQISPPSGRGLSGGYALRTTHYEPEKIVFEVETEADGLLILTDAYYPGWTTAVDGQPVSLYQADGLFRAVFVPAGQHEVTFIYAPENLRTGLIVSLVALLFLSGMGVIVSSKMGSRAKIED